MKPRGGLRGFKGRFEDTGQKESGGGDVRRGN